jgi:sugar phosphate isomerase/epimerase
MTVYISTGGYSNVSADKSVKDLIENGITSIELSGGLHTPDLIDNLFKIKEKAKFQIHNYFPPPKNPFVVNLASLDNDVANQSLEHIKNALQCCARLGSKYYSFHAGFLCDIKVSELGARVQKRELYDRKKSKDLFLERILRISNIAKNLDIQLMIENNVFSKRNKMEFEDNPFLMCDSNECLQLIKQTPKNVKLLIDVAHLKVSANSLNFDPNKMMVDCQNYIGGYHLSDNDGLSDTNATFDKNAWFWEYIRKDLNYYSIEVYHLPIIEMRKPKGSP